MQIYINNKLMNVVSRGAERDGYQRVKVAEPGGAPSAEHLIPYNFINNERSGAVYTGSCWYSWKPRDEGVHFGEAPVIASVHVPVKVERQVIPVISTSHLSAEANAWLDEWGSASNHLIVAQYDAGYFLWFGEPGDDWDTLHQSIRDIAAWAKQNRFDWVRLDRDAEQVDGLTSYNW